MSLSCSSCGLIVTPATKLDPGSRDPIFRSMNQKTVAALFALAFFLEWMPIPVNDQIITDGKYALHKRERSKEAELGRISLKNRDLRSVNL